MDIDGGYIDGTVIGATTPAEITGTTVNVTSLVGTLISANKTITGVLEANKLIIEDQIEAGKITDGVATLEDGNLNLNGGTFQTTGMVSVTNVDIDGGYIDLSLIHI